MGTPAFAVPVASRLLDAGHEVVGVYAQPDRPTGRRRSVVPGPVKRFAMERGLSVFQPSSLRRDEMARQELASLSPDLIVVAAYGLFLPIETLDMPRLGALNIHPSLLPLYRGPSPVAAAILSGDPLTGVTVMQLEERMDSGPIVSQRETRIGADESAEELTARLFQMGADLLVDVLPRWERGEIHAQPQDESRASVTSKLSKGDGEIDWSQPAVRIARQLRAYHPWPGSFTHWRGKLLKIMDASALESAAETPVLSGQVTSLSPGRVGVGTGGGILEVRRLQLEGRDITSSRDFVLGYPDLFGSSLGT